MNLKYFKLTDSDQDLKARRNSLVKQHHPDKHPDHLKAEKTAIMQRINQEYNYVLDNRVIATNKSSADTSRYYENLNQVVEESAQKFFHALTSSKGTDIDMLIEAMEFAPEHFDHTCSRYYRRYYKSLIVSIANAVKNQKMDQNQRKRFEAAVVKCKIPKKEFMAVAGAVILENLFKNIFK